MDKQQIINLLSLQPHAEGGYFTRTYQSDEKVKLNAGDESRYLLSSIYYMLTDDSPVGYLHKNKSDIIHYYHSGSPLKYTLLYPDGQLDVKVLGPKINEDQHFQLLVKGDCWKATNLVEGEYGLISEAVSPGFEYSDNFIADRNMIKSRFPMAYDQLEAFIMP